MNPEDVLKKYTPVIEWSEEDHVYLASYPDLMGPVAHAHGDSPEEAMANIKECALIHIEYELERAADGSTIAPPRTIVSTPAPARYFPNDADIEGLRRGFGISQADFSRILGVSVSTYNKWVRGVRRPSGASARLLQVAKEHPQALGLSICK